MTGDVADLAWRRREPGTLRVAVVGGSTPFLCGFVHDVSRVTATRIELRLLGRDPRSLVAMRPFVERRLVAPHHGLMTDDVAFALEGADCVLVQPRVGGLPERTADEELATSVGAPADEGLGPGGLRAALRTAPVLRGLAKELRERCPDALVVGFTNPLSTTVSVLGRANVEAVGVCELPLVTAQEVAGHLSLPLDRLEWSFSGLNHRGVIHGLQIDGRNVLFDLIDALGREGTVGGIPSATIEALEAVPLKYHALLSGASTPRAGRARQLAALRGAAVSELRQNPDAVPSAIAGRSMPWYAKAVLPLLLALDGHSDGRRLVLDRQTADGVVCEMHCDVGPFGVTLSPGAALEVPPAGATWIARFVEHERAIDALLEDPRPNRLRTVLELDPATPAHAVAALVAALTPEVERLSHSPVARNWFRE